MGRHARTIRLGRALWQSQPLDREAASSMQERLFDDGTFPPLVQVRKAVTTAKQPNEQRPAPFAGKTQAHAHLTVTDFGKRRQDWLDGVKSDAEPPIAEQMNLCIKFSQRVLLEVRLG